MAKYIVPPNKETTILVKCGKCKTLYAPEFPMKHPYGRSDFECCPVCGYAFNDRDNMIPLWKYNLIKFFRGGFRGGFRREQSDVSSTDD